MTRRSCRIIRIMAVPRGRCREAVCQPPIGDGPGGHDQVSGLIRKATEAAAS
jgi:hypothetical protein